MKFDKKDVIFLFVYPVLISLLALRVESNFFIYILLLLGIPSLYLSFRGREFVQKVFLYSVAFMPLGIIIDYIAQTSNTYFFPDTIFSFRILEVAPVEVMLWGFLQFYFIVMFYEIFVRENSKFSKNGIRYAFAISSSFLVIFLILLPFISGLLYINYFFLKLGIILMMFMVGFFIKFKEEFKRFLIADLYFIFFLLVHEVVSVKLGHWIFYEGNVIGFVNFLGAVFPIEELIFWIIISPLVLLAYYELLR